jgi:hypothetical protein
METSWTLSNAANDRQNPMAADLVIGYSAPDPFLITIETVGVNALRLFDWDGVLLEEFARRNGTLSVASAAIIAAKFMDRLQRDEPLRTQLQKWCRCQCIALEAEQAAVALSVAAAAKLAATAGIAHP